MDSQITNGKGGKPCWLRHSYSFERSRSAYIFQPWSNVILATPPFMVEIQGAGIYCIYMLVVGGGDDHIYIYIYIYLLYYVRLRVVGGALTIYIYIDFIIIIIYIYYYYIIYIYCVLSIQCSDYSTLETSMSSGPSWNTSIFEDFTLSGQFSPTCFPSGEKMALAGRDLPEINLFES